MPVLLRDDGLSFTIQNYREALVVKKPTLLKSEVRFLSQNNGEHVRLFRPHVDRIEAVFSREPGYPLGEMVWDYFDKPTNLIYCEAMVDQTNALLVIVRDNTVYLDDVLPLEALLDEFSALLSLRNEFEIYTYGDVPLAETTSDTHFAFEPNYVKSFTALHKSAYYKIRKKKEYLLLSPEQAINKLGIGRVTNTVITGVIAVVVMLIAGTILFEVEEASEKPIPKIVKVDPYKKYEQTLRSPSADRQLIYMLTQLSHTFTIPGWGPVRLSMTPSSMQVEVQNQGGTLNDFLNWTMQNKLSSNLDAQKNILTFIPRLPARPTPTKIYAVNEIVADVADKFNLMFTGNVIKLNSPKSYGVYRTVQVEVKFTDMAPSLVTLMAEYLKLQPVVLLNFTAKLKDGLLSGALMFNIVGS